MGNKNILTFKTRDGEVITFERSKTALNAPTTGATRIDEVYKVCSFSKRCAYGKWATIAQEMHAQNVHYRGNTFQFSVGFDFARGGVRYRAYITKDYNRFYEVGKGE